MAFLADVRGCDTQAALSALLAGKICLVDGGGRQLAASPDLYFGKHRRYRGNIQVVVDRHGRLIAVSQAFPGSWHAMCCCTEAAVAKLPERCGGAIAGKGDQGSSAITSQPGGKLAAPGRQPTTRLSKIRVAVGWAVAHLKNWRLLATGYHSDLARRHRHPGRRRPAKTQQGTR